MRTAVENTSGGESERQISHGMTRPPLVQAEHWTKIRNVRGAYLKLFRIGFARQCPVWRIETPHDCACKSPLGAVHDGMNAAAIYLIAAPSHRGFEAQCRHSEFGRTLVIQRKADTSTCCCRQVHSILIDVPPSAPQPSEETVRLASRAGSETDTKQ